MQPSFSGASKTTPLRVARHSGRQIIELIQGKPFPVEPVRTQHAYFVLRGDFDVFNRSQISRALAAAVEVPSVTIDLRGASYVDAGILGVLAGFAATRLRQHARPLRILNANTGLKRLFLVCRLQSSFRFEDTPK